MRLKVIACKVLFRELSFIAAKSKNYIDITTLRQGLHDTPDVLRQQLQKSIDLIDSGEDMHTCGPYYDEDFDAILIAYGLCSNGIAGLSSKKYKLVIPRAHDCITLFLGSKELYKQYFDTHKGVYWFTRGWLENAPMPGKRRYENIRQIYVKHYGEENADYLMEMEQSWLRGYNWCTFIDWPEFDNQDAKNETKKSAKFLNWNYDEIRGDKKLLEDFLDGNWDDERFLIVPPGKTVVPSYDDNIIKVDDPS
ncbi:MAG: DUF1638 domain-containing protein [Clostridiaceae bacterium]|nr:DUF1638 domain-containing protein [Clostridiaceae bacterium]